MRDSVGELWGHREAHLAIHKLVDTADGLDNRCKGVHEREGCIQPVCSPDDVLG
jgi:hypothetical protein